MHLMNKVHETVKITLLLYAVLLLLPFGFYFVYTSFDTIQKDTKIVHQTIRTGSMVEYIALSPGSDENHRLILNVDKSFQNIATWVEQHTSSDYYIGTQTLMKDFSDANNCWEEYKEIITDHNNELIKQRGIKCGKVIDNLSTIIEKMVYLKQNKIINIFYLNLIFAMTFVLFLIYMIRIYIQIQMKKHSIHDHDTKLFNKKYFSAELKISCARAIRNDAPLSILSILIDDFGKENKAYDKKTRGHILNTLGGLITSLTRTSDVACRYDEDHFSILLPDTPEENALMLEGRIREAFEKHDFGVTPELNFKFVTAHYHYKESFETFMKRTEELIK